MTPVVLQDHSEEWELLLACVRSPLGHPKVSGIGALARPGLDWAYLIEAAHYHRVLPLLYRHLLQGAAAVPVPAMQRLRAAFEANIRRNLFLTRELIDLLDLFNANEIPAIPYKGPVLALQLYGDAGLRQFSDLDLLIPVEHVPKVRTLLISRGYRPDADLTDRQLRSLVGRGKDITLTRDDPRITLEIHWRIAAGHHPVRVPPEFLWQQGSNFSIAGRSVRTLTPEALLLILCIHGTHHCWEKLIWLCDIAAIIHRPLNWDRVLDDAISLDCERILALGLSLARGLLGAELPPRVLALIDTDPGLEPLADEVKSHLFSNATRAPHTGEATRFFIRLRTRHRDRLRIAINHMRRYAAPTSRDEEALPLPASLRWVLYVLRPLRVAREYGLAPIRRVWRGLFL